jgi:formylglycine-generating enzyme required for sulfatase activity
VVDSLRIRLVLIQDGTFLMGSPDSDSHARSNEKPEHPVKIMQPFYLGACEVTVGQFREFVDATGYLTKAERDGNGGAVFDRHTKHVVMKADLNWRNPGLRTVQTDDHPVVQVCWDDANAFCKWISEREGVDYRLPTEAEWEYACRSGSQSSWCFGGDPDGLCEYAWYKHNAAGTTHPVGRKQPNAFGLYDMYGNVWEWCKDPYVSNYATDTAADPSGASENRHHVLRGGSWGSDNPVELRSASRRGQTESYRYYSCGFRVRRAIAPPVASLRSP